MDYLSVYIDAVNCGIAGWSDIWGDPIISGSVFMASYALAAALIITAASKAEGKERWLWCLCGVIFLFQVVNTHLDLHAFPGTLGRCLAHAQGWYENRRQVQLIFLTIVGVAALLLLSITCFVFYRNIVRNLLLVTGVTISLGITAVKGINHHGFEMLYGANFGFFRSSDLIELSGVWIAFVAALIKLGKKNR